jgi:hypothetical protein
LQAQRWDGDFTLKAVRAIAVVAPTESVVTWLSSLRITGQGELNMVPKPEVLVWPGAESLSNLKRALMEKRETELVLSAGLHNALFNHFGASAPAESEVQVRVQGGAELIGQLKDIAGLEPLAKLEQAFRDGGWCVTITSPTPRIMLSPP